MMNPSLRTSSASSDDTRASIAANLANKLSMSTDATGSTDHSAPPATWLPHPAPQMVDPRYPVTTPVRGEFGQVSCLVFIGLLGRRRGSTRVLHQKNKGFGAEMQQMKFAKLP